VRNSKAVEVKPYTDKHAVIPVFFNEPTDLTGWTEGVPGAGRIVAVKSILYSDGSARRWYKVEAPKINSKKEVEHVSNTQRKSRENRGHQKSTGQGANRPSSAAKQRRRLA
jgi:hypothetical protein